MTRLAYRLLPLVLAAVGCIGCSENKDPRRFVRADVTRQIVEPQAAAVRAQTVTLKDDSLRQLVSYFPGLEQVSASPRNPVAPWPPAIIIHFSRADGTGLAIAINPEYTQWVAGIPGPPQSLRAGFRQFISQQFISGQ